MTKANETQKATQYSVQEWQQLVHSVYQSRKFFAQAELQLGSRAATYKGLKEAIQQVDSTISGRQAKRQLLERQEFLATSAGTDIWTLYPNDLAKIVAAFKSWEDINGHLAVSGMVPLERYIKSSDSTAHLKDFLDIVLPNLHQHYICRNTKCSFVIRATHWFNTTTASKQGSYLCPKCLTMYRPWAATALRNPNKKFCPAAQCLVTKATTQAPPEQDGWAQKFAQGKKQRISCQHLPKSVDPATKETVYRFQGCPYEYDAYTTKVLEAEDVHHLIGLIFCKVYLTRFLQLTFKARRTQ